MCLLDWKKIWLNCRNHQQQRQKFCNINTCFLNFLFSQVFVDFPPHTWGRSYKKCCTCTLIHSKVKLASYVSEITGQIFYGCCISLTYVLAPKRCFIYNWRKCFYLLQLSNFLSWDSYHWDTLNIKNFA